MTSFSMVAIPHDTAIVSLKFDMSSFPITTSDFSNIVTYLNGDVCSYKIIPPSPSAVIVPMGPLTIYPGDSVGLAAPPGNGFTYLWSTGDTSQNIFVTDSGMYSVTVTTAGGCTSSDSVFVSFSIPLPVTLIHFQARQENDIVHLEWTTSSEINNDHFDVLRSSNGYDWNIISKIKGAGNSYSLNYYTVTDDTPINGNNYYKLRQEDFDGTSTYSEVVYVKIVSPCINAIVFPNPANEKLNFYSIENATLELYNLEGKIIYRRSSLQEKINHEINTSQYLSGNYFLKVFNENTGELENNFSVLIYHR